LCATGLVAESASAATRPIAEAATGPKTASAEAWATAASTTEARAAHAATGGAITEGPGRAAGRTRRPRATGAARRRLVDTNHSSIERGSVQ